MNPEAQAKLEELLALEPAALTDEDRAFLHARRSYLTKDQREAYGITDEAPVAEEATEEVADEAPKKSKK